MTTEGIVGVLSSEGNIDDGIISIESIPGYKDIIDKYGVYAIKLIVSSSDKEKQQHTDISPDEEDISTMI